MAHERDGNLICGRKYKNLSVALVTGDHAVGQLVKKMMRIYGI
jgi:hypothetical protein